MARVRYMQNISRSKIYIFRKNVSLWDAPKFHIDASVKIWETFYIPHTMGPQKRCNFSVILKPHSCHTSLSTQSCIRRPLCGEFEYISAYFDPIKYILRMKFKFFLSLSDANFQCARYHVKKVYFFIHYVLENMKKQLKKANFSVSEENYSTGCPNGPKTEILQHQKPPNAGLGIKTGLVTKLALKVSSYIMTGLHSSIWAII